MNNLVLLLTLLFGAQEASAVMVDSTATVVADKQWPRSTPPSNLIDRNEMLGDGGVQFFKETMEQSRLYAFLLMLDSNDVSPLVRSAKYVVMVNEAHQTNVTLTQLLAASQKNNQLLEQLIIKQGKT